ncbi:hypothetical protein IGI04_020728 [Brassica rapa subsp. trilocularis]|uniref:DNA topoisomerase 2 n=1 Tax=Brassica rapa subsp. trilocularis TaxID=1813537 RepID=A0ABQ7MJJ3_BRACM|nr:hypothetical protein IGI04_020728 [Brassica rapa subsp. trilocularis]
MNNKKNPDQKPDMSSSSSSSSPKKQTLFISSLIILWYTSNIGVLLLNKFLLSNYGFKFPIFLTMCHMSACAILSYLSIVFLKLVPLQHLKSRSQFMKVATLSVVFCASVVGGNVSLRYLPVSFNQAVGATTPFFTALFAYLMTFKREAWVTYGALVPVVTGVVIASGFPCREKLNSMNLMLYMSPIAVIALLPVTIVMEPDVMSVTLSLARQHKYMWVLLLVNSIMAYSANLLNFLVTKHTSALTLQVLGNAKGAVAVVISILLFRNPVTVMGIGGYSITVLGRPPSYLHLYFRLMASSRPRLFSHSLCPSLHRHSSSLSSSTPRIKFQLAKVLSQRLVIRNAVSPRSFMSSTMDTDSLHESSTSKDYSSEHIQVLEGLDPVRKRPGMYIGSTGSRGLHHLVYEILDNAIDEAQAGFASKIDVVLHADGSVSISDDGRGIPTDLHPATRKSSLETVLTVLHAGGKFGGKSSGYSVSGGLHGVGLSVVNALSEALEVIVRRDGMEFQHKYSRGKPITTLTCHVLPPESRGTQGTCIRFWPDKEVFTTAIQFDHNTIAGRIRELAFLNPKVTISLKKEDEDPERDLYSEYFYAGGLTEYVSWLNTDKKPLHDVLGFRKEINGTTVDVALQCSDAYSDTMLGYANSIRTIDGGTHIEGVKASLTRTLNSLAKKLKVIKEKDISLSGEHVREGLTCIVSVKVPDPEFEGQTKTRLGNPEVRKIVDQSLQEYLTEYLELHPDVLESIISKSLNAYKAALAAKRARELVRSKSILKSSSLPGKLADCSSTDPAVSEIFIVEGDSAGGSAKQGRDRRFQAILPLRGKILNIERKDEAAMYKNEEIQNLILGLGLGVKGEDFNMENLRYHKIIILTDADVDGAHIRTLLLTFFFRYQVERGKQAHYCYDEAALKQVIASFPGNASYNIQRFKGLGEMMPEQLWETTMNPDTRILKQLVVDDAAETNVVFSSLMGARVDVRKELIKSAATRINVEHLDI